MQRSFQAVLFDADGTLLNTTEFIYQAFEYTFRRHNVPAITRKKLAPLMGTPLEQVYRTVAADTDAAVLSATHREFQKHNTQLVQTYPGVLDVLQQLRDQHIKAAVITSRKGHVAASLEHTGVFRLVDVTISGNDVTLHKPHPEGIIKALEMLRVNPDDAVMVGDTPSDIKAGENAGVATVGVTWGFYGPAIKQAHPDFVANTLDKLLGILI